MNDFLRLVGGGSGGAAIAIVIVLTWIAAKWFQRAATRRTTVRGTILDTGASGIGGNYQCARDQLLRCLMGAILVAAMVFVARGLPRPLPSAVVPNLQWPISAWAFFLLGWGAVAGTVWCVWQAGLAWEYGKAWLRLERHGIEWYFANGLWFRYTFRREDGSFQYDQETRDERLRNEIHAVRSRHGRMLRCAKEAGIALVGVVVVSPLANWLYGFLYPSSSSWVVFLVHWNAIGLVQWFVVVKYLREPVAGLAGQFLDDIVYRWGFQYLPFARVIDPVMPPTTLETVKEQMAQGGPGFVPEDELAARMAGKRPSSSA
jgi:hypothetical protein